MILILLLFLAWLAAASPFGTRHPLDTRPPPLCGTPFPLSSDTFDLFEGLQNGSVTPEQASSDLLNSPQYGGPLPWPRNSQNLVVIKYCYYQEQDRMILESHFSFEGVREWMKALGGPASRETGHALVLEETKDADGNPLYCYDRNGVGPDKTWNRQLSFNTVMVVYSDEEGLVASASVGFVQKPRPEPKLMRMTFGEHYNFPAFMHEIGHVLGMTHEHQRADRDKWVAYRCHNIEGFYQVFANFRARYPGVSMQQFCDSPTWTVEYGFKGMDYTRKWAVGDPRLRDGKQVIWQVADYGEPYDHHSIMHYSSDAGSNGDCARGYTIGCPLVMNHAGHEGEFIKLNFRPSAGDIKWVKKTYPWKDPPSGDDVAGTNGTV